jgi:hypothetical protein
LAIGVNGLAECWFFFNAGEHAKPFRLFESDVQPHASGKQGDHVVLLRGLVGVGQFVVVPGVLRPVYSGS